MWNDNGQPFGDQQGFGRHMMGYGDNFNNGGHAFLGLAMMFLFIALAIIAFRAIVRPRHFRKGGCQGGHKGGCQNHGGGPRHGFDHKSPSEILDYRLAKGEISVDDYKDAKKALEKRGEASE